MTVEYIRSPRNVFRRVHKDTMLLWNNRTFAGRVIENCEALLEVGSKDTAVSTLVEHYAQCCSISIAAATCDIEYFLKDLLIDGLLTSREFSPDAGREYLDRPRVAVGQAAQVADVFCRFYKRFNLPIELHIDLTSACSERCVHCYLPDYPNRFLAYELVDKALTEFRQMQGLTVYLTGGECMLHPEFVRICHRCRELDLNFIVMSNLTLCDGKIISLLKETVPQYVNVSLYSMDAMEHDAVTRRVGSWQKTMSAIFACEKAGVHIRLAAPLLKENRRAFAGLKEFTDSHHMHLVTDCCIVPRCDHSSDNIDHACSSQELEETLVQNKEIFDRGWREADLPDCDAKVCEIGDTRICLNSKGEYYPCDGMHGFVLGNVRKDSLEKVWRGEKLNELRVLKNSDFEKCSSCEDRSFCKVCPAYNFNATGKLTETIPAQCELARVIHKVYGGR